MLVNNVSDKRDNCLFRVDSGYWGQKVGGRAELMNNHLTIERRSNPRMPVNAKCWVQRDSVTLLGTVTNVSLGGLFIRTWVSIAEGSEVDLNLTIGDEDISIKGRVVWVTQQEGESQKLGLGIEFDDSADASTIISRLRGSRPPRPQ